MDEHAVIGALLAGGEGRRMGGDKGSQTLRGRPLASYAIAALKLVGLDVTLSLHEGQLAPDGLDEVGKVYDRVTNAGPLAGIESVLRAMPAEWALVASCDQPFVQVGLLRELLTHTTCDVDVVATRLGDHIEPLPGLYRKTCLPAIELALNEQRFGVQALFSELRTCELNSELVDQLDPTHATFTNINTPEDLAGAERSAHHPG